MLVFIAVVLHKLPEGLAIASLFLAAGQSPQRAVAAAGALGLTTLLGVAVTNQVGSLAEHGLPLAAGVTLLGLWDRAERSGAVLDRASRPAEAAA